jgi:hypothetical protein
MNTRSILAALAVIALGAAATSASARTNVDVDLYFRGGSPAYADANFYVDFDDCDPDYVVIPGSSVRYVRGGDCDVYHYRGWYYAYDDGYWFKSRRLNGRWASLDCGLVPRSVAYVPERYRPRWTVVQHDPWHRHEYARRVARHEARERWADRHHDRHRDRIRQRDRHRDRD